MKPQTDDRQTEIGISFPQTVKSLAKLSQVLLCSHLNLGNYLKHVINCAYAIVA